MIVVACNTATAHALDVLREELPIPVIGVVDPEARAAVMATQSGRIGVIGTAGTIKSGAYERAIRALTPDALITARGCPLLVPLVEEGWNDHAATRLIIEEYLEPFRHGGIDTLVLGCTHYPLLKSMIAGIMGSDVRLIDSAAETAAETARGARDPAAGRFRRPYPPPSIRRVRRSTAVFTVGAALSRRYDRGRGDPRSRLIVPTGASRSCQESRGGRWGRRATSPHWRTRSGRSVPRSARESARRSPDPAWGRPYKRAGPRFSIRRHRHAPR